MKARVFLMMVMSAMFLTAPAFADCMSACLQEHGCDLEHEAQQGVDPGSTCMMFHDDCSSQCHHSEESYGAVAYGKSSGAWGMSGSFDNKKAAADDALAYCHEHGNDCKVVLELYESCAAVAEGDNDTVTWGKEATAAEAQDLALQACAKKAGNSCEIQLWHCYYP
ncbi:MAG TPA: DUF4189 domain-containing protein [Alphaproteobacteria bacterium]|nr:DUF4189 domain-containing protein [Alphaproteobacteria bacterium]